MLKINKDKVYDGTQVVFIQANCHHSKVLLRSSLSPTRCIQAEQCPIKRTMTAPRIYSCSWAVKGVWVCEEDNGWRGGKTAETKRLMSREEGPPIIKLEQVEEEPPYECVRFTPTMTSQDKAEGQQLWIQTRRTPNVHSGLDKCSATGSLIPFLRCNVVFPTLQRAVCSQSSSPPGRDEGKQTESGSHFHLIKSASWCKNLFSSSSSPFKTL